MLQRLRSRLHSEEKGFTLIELLVVILIIGILAAIALPAFLGQRARGQDASGKSNARNLVSEMESCFATNQTYVGCGAQMTAPNTGLPIGGAAGQVEVTAESANGYTIVAHSRSANNFTVTKAGGTLGYTCTVGGRGACPTGGGNWADNSPGGSAPPAQE